MPGQAQVRLHAHAARAIEFRVPSCLPSGEAATPAAQRIVRAATRCRRNQIVLRRFRRPAAPVRTSTPSFSSWLRAFADSSSVNVAEHARPGFDQQHARLARIDVAEVVAQRVPRDLGQRARELDARGPAADHREREAGIAARVIRRPPRLLRMPRARGGGSRTRRRDVLRPGACRSHSSCPK